MAYCRKSVFADAGGADVADDEGSVSAMCSSRLCSREEPGAGIVYDEITSPCQLPSSQHQQAILHEAIVLILVKRVTLRQIPKR